MSVTQESLLYSRVETVLASEITDGHLRVGDQLPTEDSLIARFEVSRITVRRAIQNLVVAVSSRFLGKGTFVAAPKMTQELTELSGFVEDMHALGRKPTARVISKEVVTADTTVASHLARILVWCLGGTSQRKQSPAALETPRLTQPRILHGHALQQIKKRELRKSFPQLAGSVVRVRRCR
jgi:DNA-binding transcriptional regulator YhcF (GntR family)